MKMCAGQFSDETVALLREAYARYKECAPEMLRTYTCSICGRAGLQAKNHAGVWHPESHDPLKRKQENPSGKVYYKK